MNQPTSEQSNFEAAVRNFVRRGSSKYLVLLPMKEGIVELRRKGASFKTIAELLATANVPVSPATVARFYREILLETPIEKPKHRRQNVASTWKSGEIAETKQEPSDPTRLKPGPRIADTKDL